MKITKQKVRDQCIKKVPRICRMNMIIAIIFSFKLIIIHDNQERERERLTNDVIPNLKF